MAETRGGGRGIHLWHPLATWLISTAQSTPQGAHRLAPLVPVPSASHLLHQAQGVQWMAPLARVPSAPLVGSLHGRPYGWRRRCPSPRVASCFLL